MKNLMIYVSPTASFDNPRTDLASNDAGPLAKVQIENSLALGWKIKDIMLVTNFDFQYGPIKATVLKDVEFFDRKPQASKINAIVKLFEKEMIEDGELYWFHDLDAIQLELITKVEMCIKNNQIGLTDYGGRVYFAGEDRWDTGSIFFKVNSKDIFYDIKESVYKKNIDEEEALGLLVTGSTDVRKRVKKLNNTYNFTGYNFQNCYKNAIKPLKIVHFHPGAGKRRAGIENGLKFFKGDNPLGVPLITDRLIKMFGYHGIK